MHSKRVVWTFRGRRSTLCVLEVATVGGGECRCDSGIGVSAGVVFDGLPSLAFRKHNKNKEINNVLFLGGQVICLIGVFGVPSILLKRIMS